MLAETKPLCLRNPGTASHDEMIIVVSYYNNTVEITKDSDN